MKDAADGLRDLTGAPTMTGGEALMLKFRLAIFFNDNVDINVMKV